MFTVTLFTMTKCGGYPVWMNKLTKCGIHINGILFSLENKGDSDTGYRIEEP